MTESVLDPTLPAVCALAGCGEPVVQPPGGGRRRLYCSNAHRAEARRRRLAGAVEPAPADVLGATLDRLVGVLDDLRRHETAVRSIDPARQASEVARVRAEATAEVLVAQQTAAVAAEKAARATDVLASERAGWDEQRADLDAHLEEAWVATAAARQIAVSATDALDVAQVAHRRQLDERDSTASRVAEAHETDIRRLDEELVRARTAAASAEARAEEADLRAAVATQAVERLRDLEGKAARLQVELSKAEGLAVAATTRAQAAEKALIETRTELGVERERRDAAVAQLGEQLATLIAATPRKTGEGKARPVRKPSATASVAPPSPTAPAAPVAGSRRRRSGGTSR